MKNKNLAAIISMLVIALVVIHASIGIAKHNRQNKYSSLEYLYTDSLSVHFMDKVNFDEVVFPISKHKK